MTNRYNPLRIEDLHHRNERHGKILVYRNSLGWTPEDAAVGSTFAMWMSDAPPATAGADDDEFADVSGGVPGGWTEVDHGSHTLVVEDDAGVIISQATHAGISIAGIYKAIPSGNFTAWTKVSLSGINDVNALGGGLALFQDATSSTGDIITWQVTYDANLVALHVIHWSAYNAFSSILATHNLNLPDVAGNAVLPSAVHLRIRRSGTTYAFDASSDGLGWIRVYSNTIAFTPTHYGLVVNNQNTGADAAARFAFFRYRDSDIGIYGVLGGDRVVIVRE